MHCSDSDSCVDGDGALWLLRLAFTAHAGRGIPPSAALLRVHGVRVRQNAGIDLLEGKQPNRGWLGPEMSGEEGATFPEKLWWAIDEAKSRLDTSDLGSQYDFELLDIDVESLVRGEPSLVDETGTPQAFSIMRDALQRMLADALPAGTVRPDALTDPNPSPCPSPNPTP